MAARAIRRLERRPRPVVGGIDDTQTSGLERAEGRVRRAFLGVMVQSRQARGEAGGGVVVGEGVGDDGQEAADGQVRPNRP